jgi:lipopolysaccharide/colanic/teichoic acid biosynthesis glycosyltransferase
MTRAQPSVVDWTPSAPPLQLSLPADARVGANVRRQAYEGAKRAIDVVLASCLLVLTAPALLISMVVIKLTSRGPVFFRQARAGRGGRPFTMYKLRTMYDGAADDKELLDDLNELQNTPVFKIRRDPRITRFGQILRRTSIDELPQLINVLRGEMSLVGPRPLPLDEIRSAAWGEGLRLQVKPGLTCLWQIAGRTEIPYCEWMQLDGYYVQNRSLSLDLKVILKTIPAVLSGRGAY